MVAVVSPLLTLFSADLAAVELLVRGLRVDLGLAAVLGPEAALLADFGLLVDLAVVSPLLLLAVLARLAAGFLLLEVVDLGLLAGAGAAGSVVALSPSITSVTTLLNIRFPAITAAASATFLTISLKIPIQTPIGK
ncbi:hypothetical protein [Methylobacillus sp. Pita1]|uniref:hypothetical protein n=1 Tax=Methylobacillus sp. Pita1 TaxID=3382642 RepID=UPI0038B4F537